MYTGYGTRGRTPSPLVRRVCTHDRVDNIILRSNIFVRKVVRGQRTTRNSFCPSSCPGFRGQLNLCCPPSCPRTTDNDVLRCPQNCPRRFRLDRTTLILVVRRVVHPLDNSLIIKISILFELFLIARIIFPLVFPAAKVFTDRFF